MRTKTLLLSAAALAAGVATSMAANVYSVNVVGYVNVTLNSGYNLIATGLDVDGVDNIGTVLPNAPDGTILTMWDVVNGTFAQPVQYFAAAPGWFDTSFNPATNNVPPGIGYFIYNPGSSATVTMVGTVVQGTNHQTVNGGYGFYGIIPPITSDLDTNGFPAQDGMLFETFVGGNYSQPYQYFAAAPGWFDAGFTQQFPSPTVAQGFLIYNPLATSYAWTSSFTVQ